MKPMTYAGEGVDYNPMDRFKKKAQLAARETAKNIARLNGGEFREFEPSRGESAYLIEAAKSYFAHVEEGLGTKNLVADAMYALTGRSYYDFIAEDTVAMIVNDLITMGALPLSVAMHLAVGSSDWFNDEKRAGDLINGWRRACDLARCSWGGGETPTLKGMVASKTCVLSGSAMGIIKPKSRLITGEKICHGDRIILISSSGIHANGLTMARRIGERKDSVWKKLFRLLSPIEFPTEALPDGYLTKLSDGRTYGETLLDPTHSYVHLVEACLDESIDIHYVVNITGHGWRKLMRAKQPFAYIIDEVPKLPPIFQFLQKHGPIDDREAYSNFNMGAGLALYVSEEDAGKVAMKANRLGFGIWTAGHIETDQKKVLIRPLNLEFTADTLSVR